MNDAVVVDINHENPWDLVWKLKPTHIRHTLVKEGLRKKWAALLEERPSIPKESLKYIITRPHEGFSIWYMKSLLEGDTKWLLMFKWILTDSEIKTIQEAGLKVSVFSKAWNDSSYLLITKE